MQFSVLNLKLNLQMQIKTACCKMEKLIQEYSCVVKAQITCLANRNERIFY